MSTTTLMPVQIARADRIIVRPLDVVEEFLKGKKATTLDSYRRDLGAFSKWLGCGSIDAAADLLMRSGSGPANASVQKYRNHLVDHPYAAATVNRKLAAIRSLIKMGRLMGLCSFTIDVEGLKAQPYRDTRGPGEAVLRQILEHARAQPDTPKNRRDIALFSMLAYHALRRAEVAGMLLEDLDMEAGTFKILGKGRHAKETITLTPKTIEALRPWVEIHEGYPALFYGMSRSAPGSRLWGESVWLITKKMGKAVGVRVWTHGIRHSSITAALDSGMGVREVRKFSRHASLDVLMRYDDNRSDMAAEVAKRVSERVG